MGYHIGLHSASYLGSVSVMYKLIVTTKINPVKCANQCLYHSNTRLIDGIAFLEGKKKFFLISDRETSLFENTSV